MWVLSNRNADEPERAEEPRVSHAGRQYQQQISQAEREALRRIDPGARALAIVATMLVLVASSLLPWIGGVPGWKVLAGQADPALEVGLLPRLFAFNAIIAGVVLGALTLATRRWALAFLTAFASGIVSFEGLVSIWSRQTASEGAPALGLIIAVICMLALVFQWVSIAWSRR